jgi:aminoglycoside phosphotransferase (APT) family kinase protein
VSTPSLVESEDAIWLVAPWIDGETGAAWLGDPERARHLARRMGRLAHDLRGVDAGALDLDTNDATSGAVLARARASMAIARDTLDAPGQAALEDALGWLDARPAGPRAFVHGDFAPVNVILDPAGEIVALLDFEHARIGPALLDVAWWGWVVRHHHPEAWSAAWTTFLTAAGVEPGPTIDREIRSLQVLRLLESVVAADDATTRSTWLGRLSEAVAW